MNDDNIQKAFALLDGYNQQDPNKLIWEGVEYSLEHFYALQLYNWVKKLEPRASQVLLLASRCQHIGRWKITRNEYPDGKAGYFKWRTDLRKFHAGIAGELMAEAGISDEVVKNVQYIILKENLRTDHEVQVMEDALCLVFLQFQYEEFLTRHDENKIVRILQKTWEKMSQSGREAALSLTYHERGKALIRAGSYK